MPLPWGITGGGGSGGGGGRVVVVVVASGAAARRRGAGFGFGTGALRWVTGVTTPAGIGWGAGMRTSGGTLGRGVAGPQPPGEATAAVARMASAKNAA
jgi:hypothetical protein